MAAEEHSQYGWKDVKDTCSTDYVLPVVLDELNRFVPPLKIIDLGCGNGHIAARLAEKGHSVIAFDVSPDGIELARAAFPHIDFRVASVYDEQLGRKATGTADCILALEVIEHLFYPRRLLEQSFRLLKPDGLLILSTPYHGYLKNLTLSITNGWDRHWGVHWDGGHIKFFSKRTLVKMALNTGFHRATIRGSGRFPWLWKSMVLIAHKKADCALLES